MKKTLSIGCVVAAVASAALPAVANGATNIAEYVCLADDAAYVISGGITVIVR